MYCSQSAHNTGTRYRWQKGWTLNVRSVRTWSISGRKLTTGQHTINKPPGATEGLAADLRNTMRKGLEWRIRSRGYFVGLPILVFAPWFLPIPPSLNYHEPTSYYRPRHRTHSCCRRRRRGYLPCFSNSWNRLSDLMSRCSSSIQRYSRRQHLWTLDLPLVLSTRTIPTLLSSSTCPL